MVKTILIDAMNTIFRIKGGLTKYEMLCIFIKELLGKEIVINEIKREHDRLREKHEPWSGKSHLEKWATIHKETLLTIFPEMAPKQAEKLGRLISARVASDISLYRVDRDTRMFLKKARERGIKLIIASNQDSKCISRLIKNFGLSKLIDRIYDSGKVGSEKPDPRFFQKILEEEKLSPRECLMVGNNLKNDVMAPGELGIVGILLDPRGLYPEYSGYKIAFFRELWQLDFFKRA